MICKYKDPGCSPDFLCIVCLYDKAIEQKDLETAEDLFVRFRKFFDEEGIVFDTSISKRKAKDLPATPKQLSFIASLAEKQGITIPKVDTLTEASKAISDLLGSKESSGIDEPSQAQINYLRALAYEKLGSSSEAWVQSIIAKGKKAVSKEISNLKNDKKN